MKRPARVLLLLLVALLASSCAVEATLDIRVRENGSGVVRLFVDADADAVRAAESGGVPLEQAVRLDDLDDAGWGVGEWARADDGTASIVLTKEFDSTEQVAGIIREASGEDGPLRLAASRDSGFLATDYGVAGKVDLEHVATGVPTDAELLANLSAQSVDPNVIDEQLLAQVKASFGVRVVVRLPGAAPRRFIAAPGAVVPIDATASVRDTNRLLFLVAALGFAILAIVMWRRGGRRRRRRSKPKPTPKPRPGSDATSEGPEREDDSRRGLHLPHVPRPHVPHPQLPHPHLPHPRLPGRSRPAAPPRKRPPDKRPPMIPPGMT